MKKLLSLAVAASLLAATAYAGQTPTTFSLPLNTQLTMQIVDYAWSNREDMSNQQVIADYLMTKPQIPEDYEIAWKTARLVSFIGNYGYGESAFVATKAGVKLFDYGVKAAKIAIKVKSKGVEGQYWYAVDLGSYGLANGIMSSASNAGAGMDALRAAIDIDASYQWYGSSRILGRYYQELPGLFGGSNKKALQLLTLATEKAPQYRNNWVFLGQYYLATGDYQQALMTCQKALSLPNLDGKYEELRFTREAKECVGKAKAKLS
jgi:tetratricopeptide (TPR) repeat protein